MADLGEEDGGTSFLLLKWKKKIEPFLAVNLYYQSFSAFTNIYVSIAVFSHLWRTLFYAPYEGKCIVNIFIFLKGLSFLKAISAYYTTLLANHNGPASKHVPLFVVVPRGQIRRMKEDNTRTARLLDLPLI